MCKLLYVVKFSKKHPRYKHKVDEYFYNDKKSNNLVDEYRTNDYHFATLHTLQPTE